MINAKKQEYLSRGSSDFPMEYYLLNTSDLTYNLPFHWHMDFEFIHVLRGEYGFFAGTHEYSLNPGDFFIMSSGILHGDGTHFSGKCVYESLVFSPDMMCIKNYKTDSLLERLTGGQSSFSALVSAENKELYKSLSELFRIVKMRTEGFEFYTISKLFCILGEINKADYIEENEKFMQAGGKKLAWLKSVMNLIRQKYREPLSLTELAESAGFSPKYFCRLFHEVTNYTPMGYLNQYRINRAAEALMETELSVEDVAYQCGFNDISYFITLFKRYKGITPLKYRVQKR